MRTLQKFVGINNVKPAEELTDAELTTASNVDIDHDGRARRRAGYTLESETQHANVWAAGDFTLATRGDAGDLVNISANTVLVEAVGHDRMWYWNLPGGRTLYSNGVAQGIVTAEAAKPWGVPIPASLGAATDTAGLLHPGKYQWALTHVRLSDGAESGPLYSGAEAIDVVLGGLAFTGIPVLSGYRTNVYLTSHYGGERFFAGYTLADTFSFTGKNLALQMRCPTEFMQPPPAGRLVAMWRGRTLVAVDNVLFASRGFSWELFDLRRDFKQFSGTITLVQPVDGGIWVGTSKELAFLSGSKWDDLVRSVKLTGAVLLGSGARVPGEHIGVGKGRAQGDCMMGIAGGWVVAGLPDGTLVPMTVDRYRADFEEVAATFRMADKVPQYVALEL